MKRSQFSAKLQFVLNDVRSRIKLNPERAVAVALVIGLLCGLLPRLTVSVVFLAVVAFAVLWFMADGDSSETETETKGPENVNREN